MGNPRRKPHKQKGDKPDIAFGTHLSSDNAGPQPVRSVGGSLYLNIIIDHHTNWIWVKGLKKKSESVAHLRYVAMQELNGVTIVIRTDQGGEFMNHDMGELVSVIGATHQTSASGDSQQNGRAEKAIQDIMAMVRVFLCALCRGLDLWMAAAKHETRSLHQK